MPEANDSDTQKKWLKSLLPTSVAGWVDLFHGLKEGLGQLSMRKQIRVGLVGLLVAFVCGYLWWSSYRDVSDRIQTGIDAKIENTVDQHKGLAAYLLSNIEPTPAPMPALSPELQQALGGIRTVVDERSKTLPQASLTAAGVMGPPTPSPTPTPALDKGDSRKLHLPKNDCVAMPPDSPIGQALVAGDDSFYLFLPVMSVRREELNNLPLRENDDGALRKALDHNPDILRDLSIAWDLIPKLQGFDKIYLNGQEVTQIYFIFESGLILLRSPGIKNQLEFYGQQFDTNHNFPDRPYFWHAVLNENKKHDAGFNYASEPYIDLGGHGLIKTYSKAFRLANGRYGVLGVDVQLDERLREEIKRRLAVLGGRTTTYWTNSEQQLDDSFKWVGRVIKRRCPQAEILGKITSQKEFPEESEGRADGIFRYSIPLSTSMKDANTRSVELMLVSIDFTWLLVWQYALLALVCVGVGTVVAVAANIIDNYKLLTRKLSELAEKIDEVMEKAETPYVRLNSNNNFVKVNQKFLDMVDYGNINVLQDEAKTFIHMLTPDSQKLYRQKMDESKRGKPTDEYTIILFRRDRTTKVRARVRGESIDFPTFTEEEYPHRFGIVISWELVKEAAQASPARPAQA
jgi:PAS domain-containing protein